MKTLYAHGKLLISAEYMVMHGSRALALPLKLGQSLKRLRTENRRVFSWKAGYKDRTWFSARLDPANLKILESSDPRKAEFLRNMIRACIEMAPSFQEELFRWDVETELEFSPLWGLGSSSTLIALLAEWAQVNPLDLYFLVSEGSGYDVACAIAEGPILYRLRNDSPNYQHVPFQPGFADRLWFAWLGSKQDTADHLEQLSGRLRPDYETLHRFTRLTEDLLEAKDLAVFRLLMEEHEQLLSGILGMEMISSQRLHGLPGSVKSLGAWGGDFVMIASEAPEKDLFDYLHGKDIHVIYRYLDMVYYGRGIWEDTTA